MPKTKQTHSSFNKQINMNNPNEFRFKLNDVTPVTVPNDITAYKTNKNSWPILEGITIVKVEIPGKQMRAPHLHTNASELSVIVKGSAIAYLIDPENTQIEVPLLEGDCVYFPMGWVHWLVNTSEETLISYFNYNNDQPITQEVTIDSNTIV